MKSQMTEISTSLEILHVNSKVCKTKAAMRFRKNVYIFSIEKKGNIPKAQGSV